MLQINALGGLTFELDGKLLQLTTRVDEALLAYLIAHNRPIPRDQLIDLLWQNSNPQQANNNFRSALSRLRKLFGDYLIVTRQSVAFDHAQPHRFDVTQFEAALLKLRSLLDSASGLNDEQRWALTEAIALYRGDFLAGFVVKGSSAEFEGWILLMQERLRILATAGFSYLTQHATRSGTITTGLSYATQLVTLDPLNETAHRLKMRLHLRNRNRSAALKQYVICRQLLADELATEPLNATTAFFEQLQHATPNAGNLPSDSSPFVGRSELINALVAKLSADETRLVTLTGMGGIGKTRLALTVARHFVGRLLNGVYFVPLIGVTEPSGIAEGLADALGISKQLTDNDQQSTENEVAAYLRERECLIIFDNYEPLLTYPDATVLIERLLHEAPAVRLFVTSRESLQLYEELVITLDGLQDDAPTLFTQHATRNTGKPIAESELIPHICQLVDGIPLAVELAAGSTRTHDLATIADGIAASFDALQTTMRNVPSRQRSLRAVFDYSWALLTDEQQKSLARLGVFVAGFDLTAAEELMISAEITHALMAKSLLQLQPENRYALHPLIREFANDKLQEPQRTQVARRFVEHYSRTFVRWGGLLSRGQVADSLAAWQHDHANVAEAWRRAVKLRDPLLVQRLVMPLSQFHGWRNWYVSAENLYALAINELADWRDAEGDSAWAMGEILERHAYFAFAQGNYDDAIKRMRDALPVIERGGDPLSITLWRRDMVQILTKVGDYTAARTLVSEFLAESDPTSAPAAHANLLFNSSSVFKDIGDYERATTMLNEALEIFDELNDTRRILLCQYALANTARARGDYVLAIDLFRRCMAARADLDDPKSLANTQASLADALYAQGELEEAGQLAATARDTLAELGDRIGWPYPLNVLGNIARDRGERERAQTLYQEALQMAIDTKRMMKVAELLLDWLLLMEDELERDFFLGGLVAIGGWDSAESEHRRLAQQHLNHRTAPVVPINSLIHRATTQT